MGPPGGGGLGRSVQASRCGRRLSRRTPRRRWPWRPSRRRWRRWSARRGSWRGRTWPGAAGEHGGLAFALGGDEGLGGGLEGVHHRLVALAGAGDGADFLEAALEEVGQLVGVERGGALGGGVGHAFEPGAVERGGGAGGLFLELLGHVGQEGGEVVALGVVDGVDGGDDGGAVVAVAAGGGVQLGEVLFVGLDGGLGLLPHGLELFERHGCSFFCGRGAVAAGGAAATARP